MSAVYFDLMMREYARLGLDPEPLAVARERAATARAEYLAANPHLAALR